jgi:hypothetical protein
VRGHTSHENVWRFHPNINADGTFTHAVAEEDDDY